MVMCFERVALKLVSGLLGTVTWN